MTAAKEQVDATPPPVARIIEAMLFAGERPITAKMACSAIRGLTADQFRIAIDELSKQYRQQNRPYVVRGGPKGYALALKPIYRQLQKQLGDAPRPTRLSQQSLDVLSIVVYKQPVTRKEIDSLCQQDSSPQLRQLVRLGLITTSSALKPADASYSTTPRFLELLGLKSLDDMPRALELKKI